MSNLVLDAKAYQRIKSIQWSNRWTDQIRRDMGDQKACIGFDPDEGVWLFAVLLRTAVKRHYGDRSGVEYEILPHIWQQWRAHDGTPLPIEPWNVVLEHWRICDKLNGQFALEAAVLGEQKRQSQERAAASLRHGTALELRPHIAKLGELSGATYHRPTAHDGGVISSAALSRRGAGA